VIKFVIISQHFYGGGLEEDHENLSQESRSPCRNLTSPIRRSANHSVAMFDVIVRYVLSRKTMLIY
jgi:hypothetical protein